jgi:hypothetical protein
LECAYNIALIFILQALFVFTVTVRLVCVQLQKNEQSLPLQTVPEGTLNVANDYFLGKFNCAEMLI